MKLNDVYTKPLKDIVEQMSLTDMKVHTDDTGDVKAIELKYEPDGQSRWTEVRARKAKKLRKRGQEQWHLLTW